MTCFRCALLLPFFVLVQASAGDFKIGPDAAVDSVAISAGTQNYLVTWRDLRSVPPQIRGALVNTGGLASADFLISGASAVPLKAPVQHATAASDLAQFLVVWADNRAAAPGIWGAFVSFQGTASPEFLISTVTRSNDLAPQVIFTGSDYLVAWQDTPQASAPNGTQIYHARISLAGAPSAVSALPNSNPNGPLQSLEFLVAGTGSEVLFVFQDLAATPNVTMGTRLESDNTYFGSSLGTLLFKRDFSANGFGVPIGALYNGTAYNIVSSLGAQIDSTVFKTRLNADDSVTHSSVSFAEVGQGATGLDEDAFPRASTNGSSEFLFIRNSKVSDIAYHILTKRVTTDGTDRDKNMTLIDTAAQGILNGGVGASIGNQYLVVWMDGRREFAQPAGQLNIYGALIDNTKDGDPTNPSIKAIAHASPQIGNSPLITGFGISGSTGVVDAIHWDFGDGGTAEVGSVNHTYNSQGIYMAVLTLVRAGFEYHDFIRIFVDENTLGGAGGPPQTIGGSLGPIGNGVDSDLFATGLSATLNFAKAKNDSLRFAGFIDPSSLPVKFPDTSGSLTIGGNSYSFTLDKNQTFTSNGNSTTPTMNFRINPFTGGFAFTTSIDSLADTFAAFGATNETLAKPGKDIVIPYSFTFGTVTQQSFVTAKYTATAGKNGLVNYAFGTTGQPGSGYIRVFQTQAVENKKGSKVHKFGVTGNMGLGNGAQVLKAATGRWRITLGNFTEDIPVASLKVNGGHYLFKSGNKTGITAFSYDTKLGIFGINFNAIPADGETPSGMPLSNSTVSRADLALSFDFDTADGGEFQASVYARFGRAKLNSLKWKTR